MHRSMSAAGGFWIRSLASRLAGVRARETVKLRAASSLSPRLERCHQIDHVAAIRFVSLFLLDPLRRKVVAECQELLRLGNRRYNNTRLTLTGDQLRKPDDFGTKPSVLHPVYVAVVDDYRRGVRLNKSVRIYARPSTAAEAAADTCRWSALIEHLVGAVNALPAIHREVVTQRLHLG